jgi:hypothetical protein
VEQIAGVIEFEQRPNGVTGVSPDLSFTLESGSVYSWVLYVHDLSGGPKPVGSSMTQADGEFGSTCEGETLE